jgi:hypothetical protein
MSEQKLRKRNPSIIIDIHVRDSGDSRQWLLVLVLIRQTESEHAVLRKSFILIMSKN